MPRDRFRNVGGTWRLQIVDLSLRQHSVVRTVSLELNQEHCAKRPRTARTLRILLRLSRVTGCARRCACDERKRPVPVGERSHPNHHPLATGRGTHHPKPPRSDSLLAAYFAPWRGSKKPSFLGPNVVIGSIEISASRRNIFRLSCENFLRSTDYNSRLQQNYNKRGYFA